MVTVKKEKVLERILFVTYSRNYTDKKFIAADRNLFAGQVEGRLLAWFNSWTLVSHCRFDGREARLKGTGNIDVRGPRSISLIHEHRRSGCLRLLFPV